MKNYSLVMVLSILVALVTACGVQRQTINTEATGFPSQDEPKPIAHATSTTKMIPTNTRALSAPTTTRIISTPTTVVEQAFSFQELISYVEGGGGGECAPYSRPLPLVDRDSVRPHPERQYFNACLLGLPGGELVNLSIVDPQGWETPWITVRVPDQMVIDSIFDESFTRVWLPGFQSLVFGPSEWKLVARFSGETITGSLFDLESAYWWSTGAMLMSHSRVASGAANNPLDPTLRKPYQQGETVYLQGINFTPNNLLQLGLYQGAGEKQFIRSFTVNTDSQGGFETILTINEEFTDGYYSVIPSEMFDPQDMSSPTDGSFATFQVLNRLPYQACNDLPLSNLVVGIQAVMVDKVANNLRPYPGLYDTDLVFGQIQPGEEVLVLDGPGCGSGYVWWLVYTKDSQLIGWTAEGDSSGTWLAPLE